MNPCGYGPLTAKFALDKPVIIKLLVRQTQPAALSSIRPAGLFIRTAFGAGLGFGRNLRATIGTSHNARSFPGFLSRGHGTFSTESPNSSVFLVCLQIQPHQN